MVDRSTISRLWRNVHRKTLYNTTLQPDEPPVDVYASDATRRRKGKFKHNREQKKQQHYLYHQADARSINRIWLTLQAVMNEIIKCHGGAHYKLPHMGKDRLEHLGALPEALEVCPEVDGMY